MNRSVMLRRGAVVCLLGVLAGSLAACSGEKKVVPQDSLIRNDPSPELLTLYQREVDVDNVIALTINENKRSMQEDLLRLLLLDRPSRLHREPSPR